MTVEPVEKNPVEAILEYMERHAIANIGALPGVWDSQIDATWRVMVNGHRETRETADGLEVPPFTFVVFYLGNPAAVLGPYGDGVFVDGDMANARTFIAAMEVA